MNESGTERPTLNEVACEVVRKWLNKQGPAIRHELSYAQVQTLESDVHAALVEAECRGAMDTWAKLAEQQKEKEEDKGT